MKLILVNSSTEAFSYLNGTVVVPANDTLDVNSKYWTSLYNDIIFLKDLRYNNFTINDGVTSYSYPQSESYIQKAVDSVNFLQTLNQPFAAKILPNGKKLYTRVHGISAEVSGSPDTIEFTIPYATCKLTGIEIIGGNTGDKVNLKILDTAAGLYSGVPNYMLNQFGFDVNVAKDFYSRESAYDADLFLNMKVKLEYDSVATLPANVYINFILHEVKD